MKTRKILISILLAVILVFTSRNVYGEINITATETEHRVYKPYVITFEAKEYRPTTNYKYNMIIKKGKEIIDTLKEFKEIDKKNMKGTLKIGGIKENTEIEVVINELYYYDPIIMLLNNGDDVWHSTKKMESKKFICKNPEITTIDLSKDIIAKSKNKLKEIKVTVEGTGQGELSHLMTPNISVGKNYGAAIVNKDGKQEQYEYGSKKLKKQKEEKNQLVMDGSAVRKARWTESIPENSKIIVEVSDECGFKTSESFYYVFPEIKNVKLKDKKIQFDVYKKKNGNDIKNVSIYKVDKDSKNEKIVKSIGITTTSKDKKIESKVGTYIYDGDIKKGDIFNIYATDEYGIKTKYTYTAKNVSSGGGGGGGYYGGETVDNTTAPTVSTVEFIKNDGTPLQVNQEGEKYFNEMINEEVTVNITYDKEVKISDNNINSGWTTAEGNKITKKFTKGETETVSVTATEGTSSCNTTIEVKIDKDPPVIKINGEEVEAKIAKDGEREEVEADETVTEIDKYTEEVTIEVEDDQIEEKDVPDHVKLFKDEIEYDFKNKMKITELGTYTIEATDEMGNKAIYTFILTVNKEDIKINSKNIRITSDGKAIVTNESNITRGMFQNELKLNINSDISIKGKGKNAVELGNVDNIETGMKLKIGDIEYDIIVAGDIATNVNGEEDEKGAVTLIDGIIASCILNLNEGEILVEEDWDMNKKTLEKLLNVEINRLDMNLDGKVDEEDKKELEKELGDIDDIEIDTILDINEDGDFNEEDVRLIKYALDTNGDGTFDQEDMDEITENLQINFVKQETEKTTENNGDEEEPEETTENNEDEEELEETTEEDEE